MRLAVQVYVPGAEWPERRSGRGREKKRKSRYEGVVWRREVSLEEAIGNTEVT